MKMPEQYKTGVAYFMDFEFNVSTDTFIPRPETEILVEKTIEAAKNLYAIRNTPYAVRILDMGTGSGNIAISLTKYIPQSKITALDISHEALMKAKENAARLNVADRIDFIEGNLFSGIENGVFDIIVSNPPYVSAHDMAGLPDDVKREPRIALYGGEDGLNFYRAIIKDAKIHLKQDGYLIMEIGYDQAMYVKSLLEKHNYTNIEIFKDYSSIDRVIRAQAEVS